MHSQKNHIAFKNDGVYKPSTNGKLGQGKSIHVAAMFPTIFPPLRTRNHCMLMPRSMCSSGWTISNLVILASIRRSRRVAFPLSKFCWCLPRTKSTKKRDDCWPALSESFCFAEVKLIMLQCFQLFIACHHLNKIFMSSKNIASSKQTTIKPKRLAGLIDSLIIFD